MKQSPIFSRTYDLLHWLIPVTVKFPRTHRFVMAENIQRVVFDFQECIVDAAHGQKVSSSLKKADAALSKLRIYLRLCIDLQLLSTGQYAHVGKIIDEIGRLLGGWIKSLPFKH